MHRVDVVIGVIVRGGRLLISRRKAGGPLGGFWEFPGGKRDIGETLDQCLARELAEELAVAVTPYDALPSLDYDYPTALIRLHPYLCTLTDGEPKPLASEELRWVTLDELATYPFPPANDRLLHAVTLRLRPPHAEPSRSPALAPDPSALDVDFPGVER